MPQQCILNQAVNMELNYNFKIMIFLRILQMKKKTLKLIDALIGIIQCL